MRIAKKKLLQINNLKTRLCYRKQISIDMELTDIIDVNQFSILKKKTNHK